MKTMSVVGVIDGCGSWSVVKPSGPFWSLERSSEDSESYESVSERLIVWGISAEVKPVPGRDSRRESPFFPC
jgi:hypothetical protein